MNRKARRRRRRWLALGAGAALIGLVAGALVASGTFDKALRELTLPLKHEDVIRQQASEKGVDAALIAAVIYSESKFSDATSSAGARGLMQITPAAAEFIERQSGATTFEMEDLSDPEINIRYGTFLLKELLERFVDFDAIRKCQTPQLFVTATNVQTGHLRIFPHDKITADAILASACLPLLFRAVEIDGVPYWDGGYLGNPSIFPLFSKTQTEDVLLIQINPLVRQTTPTSSQDIVNRLNEITFNSPLMGELRAIDFVTRLIDEGRLPRGLGHGKYRRINMHRIALEASAKQLNAGSKLNTDYDFFELLRNNGRRAARRFLDAHFDDIGVRGTVDLQAEVGAEWA